MPSRWDRLFDLKPIPILDHLLEEVAKLLHKDLAAWPPPVESLDAESGASFSGLFEPEAKRPSPRVYEEALRLARFELTREHEAYDDYVRNQRYLEQGLAPTDKPALLFLSRWLLEQMLALGESTEGRVKRPHMVQCLERLSARLRSSPL